VHHGVLNSSRRLRIAIVRPADAHPTPRQRLVSLASKDANRGSNNALIDENVLASIVSAAAVGDRAGNGSTLLLRDPGCMDV
jgi:hypothetical protein